MRILRIAVFGAIAAVVAFPQEQFDQGQRAPHGARQEATVRQTGKRSVARRLFGPLSFVRTGAAAGIGQAAHAQPEWGQGAAGYGKRLDSAFTAHLVVRGIQVPIAYILHEELDYQPSGKQGFGPRLSYALLSTVYTHKTTTGEGTIAVGEIAGVTGGGLISRLWQPASARTLAKGFGSAGMMLGADAGYRVLREFWPRHHLAEGHPQEPARPSETH